MNDVHNLWIARCTDEEYFPAHSNMEFAFAACLGLSHHDFMSFISSFSHGFMPFIFSCLSSLHYIVSNHFPPTVFSSIIHPFCKVLDL